jgi:hypothetical protein
VRKCEDHELFRHDIEISKPGGNDSHSFYPYGVLAECEGDASIDGRSCIFARWTG